MGFSNRIISRALEKKRAASKARQTEYHHALDRIEREIPEFYDIKLEQRRIGAESVRAAMQGDTEKIAELQKKAEVLSLRENEILAGAGVKPPKFDCERCEDSGYLGTKICDCVRCIARSIAEAELNDSLPIESSSFNNFNLDYYPKTADSNGISPYKRMGDILKFCINYADNFTAESESILFLGAAGLGKTHLSLAIASEVTKKGFGVVYSTAQNLFLKLEEEYFSHSGNDFANAVLDSDLLIIDDLGSEFVSKFSQSTLYNIVNTRILKNKPTVISTNLSLSEIEEKYSARISSRFIGNYILKKFIGNDIRQLKALKK